MRPDAKRIRVEAGDEVVIALPQSYQQAVLPSLLEHIPTGVNVVHVGSCRVSGLDDVQVLAEHPRVREVVDCGFNMLRTRLLTTYIAAEDGVCELQRLDRLAGERMPERSRAKRRKVSDDELEKIVRNLDADITRANSRTVHHLRHKLHIATSSERVAKARAAIG